MVMKIKIETVYETQGDYAVASSFHGENIAFELDSNGRAGIGPAQGNSAR